MIRQRRRSSRAARLGWKEEGRSIPSGQDISKDDFLDLLRFDARSFNGSCVVLALLGRKGEVWAGHHTLDGVGSKLGCAEGGERAV